MMLATLALLLLLDQSQLNSQPRRLDIPPGQAKHTLHDFLTSQKIEFLLDKDEFSDIVTKPVHGIVTPCEALRIMIAGTPIIVWDEKTDVEAGCAYSPLRLRY